MGLVDQSRMRRARVGACCASCEKDEEKPDVGMIVARSANPGPTVDWIEPDWLPATFFDAPPTPTTRRWVKLISPLETGWGMPGMAGLPSPAPNTSYYGKLMRNFGAQQENVIVVTRTIALPSGGTRIEAAVTPALQSKSSGAARRTSVNAGPHGGYHGGRYTTGPRYGNPAPRRTTAGVQDFALAAAVPAPNGMPLGFLARQGVAAIDPCANGWCQVEKVSAAGRAYARQHRGAGLAAGVVTTGSARSRGFVVVTPNAANGNRRVTAKSITALVQSNPMAFVSPIQPQGFGFGDEFWVHSMSASDYPFWSELLDLVGGYSSWGSTMDVKFRCNSYLGCDELDADINDINYDPLTIKRNGLKNGTWYTCTWSLDGGVELVSCVAVAGGGGGIDHSGLQDSFYQEPNDASFMPGLGFPATRRRNSRGSAGSFSGGGFRQGGM